MKFPGFLLACLLSGLTGLASLAVPLKTPTGVVISPGVAGRIGDSVKKESFGRVDGQDVELYTLTNRKGTEARITTYGATVVSLKVPDRKGKFDDVVLGFDDIDGYLGGTAYFGATIGRYANRIAKGRFTLMELNTSWLQITSRIIFTVASKASTKLSGVPGP